MKIFKILFLNFLVLNFLCNINAVLCPRYGACSMYGNQNSTQAYYIEGRLAECERCVAFGCFNDRSKLITGVGCLQDFFANCKDIQSKDKHVITTAKTSINVTGLYVIYASCDYAECAKTNFFKLMETIKTDKNKSDEFFHDLLADNGTCKFNIYNGHVLNFTDEENLETSVFREDKDNKLTKTTIWALVGILSGMLLLSKLAVIWCILRKKRRQQHERRFHSVLKTNSVASHPSAENPKTCHFKMKLPGKNIAVDFDNVLGKGAYSTVYKATLKLEPKRMQPSSLTVAVKIANSLVDQDQFIRELNALICIGRHPHIIECFGWTTYNENPVLIMEFAHLNLLTFAQGLRGLELPIKTILSILWQISQALEYLAAFKMVHRDVACRNILLMENNCAKLSDFGLCCHCDDTLTYTTSSQKRLPLKWLSIEAIVDRKFSEKSDVWAFGILCYEIFTYGSVPYPTLSNNEMLEFLQDGNRLEQPQDCPKNIYEFMIECWKKDPSARPSFNSLCHQLRQMLEVETADYGYISLSAASTDEDKISISVPKKLSSISHIV